MTVGSFSQEVRAWLEGNGWVPGRDIGEAEAGELIDVRVQDSRRQGNPLVPVDAAVRVIRAYGGLTLRHPRVEDFAMEMRPTVGYEGDAALISELATQIGKRLFPVGYDSAEYGLILVDEIGRFFHLHHTGAYFWGLDEQDAFARFLSGAEALDAEDFFV
ncbi:SUKH-3 domain-containing protein [Streptomyces sp. NPDC047071]|uniref:SUKH-3 domain-containing protein n=1 Tax=Streptomyces sp. NPDC047071 TaxID=3154808 RepID=UPI0034562357